MDATINAIVGLHILGIAALLGGYFTQLKVLNRGTGDARFVPGMVYGALTMLVTGIGLIALDHADDRHPSEVKLTIKLVVLLVILGLVYAKRNKTKVDAASFGAVGALTTANIFIAVLWT